MMQKLIDLMPACSEAVIGHINHRRKPSFESFIAEVEN